MRPRFIIAISIPIVVLIVMLGLLITQRNHVTSDISLKLHPLQKWTDDLLIHIDEVPTGWTVDGIKTKSHLGTATRLVYFKNPTATDIPFINFYEELVPYSNPQVATNNYQRWVDDSIPPAAQDSWQQTPELDFAHHADQMKIRCLSGEVNRISHRVCVVIAQYQNLIMVAGAIIYDKWLPASAFRQILSAMDQRIVRVLSTQPENLSAAQQVSNSALPFAIPTPTSWRGGTRIVLATTGCPRTIPSDQMNDTRKVIESRLKDAGVYDSFVQVIDCQLEVVVPPVTDRHSLITLIQEVGYFELVATGSDHYPSGIVLRTTGVPSPTVPFSRSLQSIIPETVYETIVTGADLDIDKLQIALTDGNAVQLFFALKYGAAQRFAQFTAAYNETTNGGKAYYICIVFDSVVQSCPTIRGEIPNGQGIITLSNGSIEEANRLLKLFRSGALPLRLQVVSTDTIR